MSWFAEMVFTITAICGVTALWEIVEVLKRITEHLDSRHDTHKGEGRDARDRDNLIPY